MRRVFRPFFTLCCAASLLLSVAFCVLWARSYHRFASFGWAHSGVRAWQAYSRSGRLILSAYSPAPHDQAPTWRFWDSTEPAIWPPPRQPNDVDVGETETARPPPERYVLSFGPGSGFTQWRKFGVAWTQGQADLQPTDDPWAWKIGTRTLGTARFWEVDVPHWMPAVLLGLPPMIVFSRRALRRHRSLRNQRLGLCARCGYDLRASPGRCPECGDRAGADRPATTVL